MKILGIETSCDDTSAAVVENGCRILSNVVSSQIRIHKKFNGVVPELASRKHLENINNVIGLALEKTKKIDAVAVTEGPGLIGSLLIGASSALAISQLLGVPVFGINHIEGHIFSNYLYTNKFRENSQPVAPFLALIISGGHTDLIIVKKKGKYEILGRTRDDAVGEAFDKVAKFLGLGYPGGPVIDRLSWKGDPGKIKLPRPYMPWTWDFSFSGLKTAVINYASAHQTRGTYDFKKADLCASFQKACVDVVLRKTIDAANKYRLKRIVLGGGVSSNSLIRILFEQACAAGKIKLHIPPPEFCTDNAAMIAAAAYHKMKVCGHIKKTFVPLPDLELHDWKK
ncbi:MAG: tRNA N6-adenosine threonylcarbamoyltransferase [Elusimicrobia bacterium ADurb.Bin231]|nr:MAG: tRNA N6-adenosine threonylcarbamoyltransferase [Elusimicrobia bacterium ADurb.Bin231]